jgi:transcriptional regulator with XRE-family HTH domain
MISHILTTILLPIRQHICNFDRVEETDLTMFGERLHGLRVQRGWTLEELAERSGLSKPFLSRLEGGSRQPSISAVMTLARVFGVSMSSLFEPTRDDEFSVIVRGDKAPLRQGEGISYTTLSGASRYANLQPIRLVVSASRLGNERYQHEGEEWVFVLTGRLRLLLGERQYDLNPGDAAHFDSRLPHRLVALDGKDVETIVVACPIPIALNHHREMSELTAGLAG